MNLSWRVVIPVKQSCNCLKISQTRCVQYGGGIPSEVNNRDAALYTFCTARALPWQHVLRDVTMAFTKNVPPPPDYLHIHPL